ncbi:MAG: DUF6002 family protein, partial [Tumebacillaceae bacterium]
MQQVALRESIIEKFRSAEDDSLIIRYYEGVRQAFASIDTSVQGPLFQPAFELPDLDEGMKSYFSVVRAEYQEVGEYQGKRIFLLDLMKNKGTNTTKSLASLLMVARAINHIRKTGESILMFTPSSGNKAIALRDAVERAVTLGLVQKEQLRIMTLIPKESEHKLRESELTRDPELRRLNPVFLYEGEEAQTVKTIGRQFIDEYGDSLYDQFGLRIWYSLDIRNYKVADAMRAFYDYEHYPWHSNKGKRLHAHSVSSAYGLLGYNYGLDLLQQAGMNKDEISPGYLLVQHSRTCDMVLNLLHGSFSRDNMPNYRFDEQDGLYKQEEDKHFPFRTWSVIENVDSTFYTHEPATSPEMNALIEQYGGSGIVVSKFECMERLERIRELLSEAGLTLPTDPNQIYEWSL